MMTNNMHILYSPRLYDLRLALTLRHPALFFRLRRDL